MDSIKLAALVRQIGDLAPQVGQEHSGQHAAIQVERAAETKLLERAIEMAQPGLEAISNRLELWEDWRGVVVIDKWSDNNEDVNTRRIYVLASGELAEEWRCFSPDEDLNFSVRRAKRSARYIIDRYNAADIIAVLHREFAKQVGKRVPSTERALNSAKKMNAILTLLDVPVQDPEIPF
jgi:hypothetical protein